MVIAEKCAALIGAHKITDSATCKKAAIALGLSASSVQRTSHNSRPRGCISNRQGTVVYLNTATSDLPCDYSDMSCICSVSLPVCDWQNGTRPHDSSSVCACGTTVCDHKTGMTCTASTCSISSPCKFTKSLKSNENVCGCGHIDCTSSTGFFCNAKLSRCSTDGKLDAFAKKESGLCDSDGVITDAALCNRASTVLGLKTTSVSIEIRLLLPSTVVYPRTTALMCI